MVGGAILDKRGKEDLSDEVREKAMWEKSIPGRINNLCKGPGAGICLVYVCVEQQGSQCG